MKNIFSIAYAFYFLVAGMIPQTDFSQLARYPDAWKHFRLHVAEARACGDSFTMIDFFSDHYLNPDNHSHDDSRSHDNLPLYHVLHGVFPFSLTASEAPSETILKLQDRSSFPADHQNVNSADFVKGLYRPPIFS